MSFPLKPSASKSGRLTRQANVTSGGSHSHDIPSTSDSFLQSLNPRSTLLLRAELPKPMSRLPEIRLDDGSGGSGGKVQVGQVKPQKSCESYDSAASGMSWSSSQSTVAVGGGYCNSTSVSGNPSFTSYEEDEEPLQSHPQQSIVQIPSTPSALHRTQYSPRHDNAQHRMGHPFRTNYSFEEVHITSEQVHEQTRENKTSEERTEAIESPREKADEFFDSVFDKQEKEPAEKGESSIAPRGSAKKKSFRRFWKLAYRAIRSEASNRDGNSKFGSPRKKSGSEETEGEIDPVYQLLKSAATQRHLSAKNSTSSDHGGHTGQPPRLSSSSRASSTTQKEQSP
ncbi:hypothetical protein ECG_02815 [Echinococcus granulosus]|uniref:Uncharacterized protein n=1 Tax=Echinococcus granulosus TaxID=6210 RepID=A0A068WRH0_ECHGR|nr:hypothetical protein ECG_02815 [Echinococcus granulosus]CDS20222.1 hypothetical protein EgrG_000243300 [Echinococcus granulosus]